MAVPAYSRDVNLLQVFAKARGLLVFTIRTTRNEKHFKKRYHDDLADPIVGLVRRITHDVFEADEIDNSGEESLRKRLALQEDAARAYTALSAELLIAHEFGLSDTKLREWTVLLEDFYSIFNKWRKSDQRKLLGR